MANNSNILALASQIRKELHVSQKEAYAIAKTRIEAGSTTSLYDQLVEKMKDGVVKFTHKNKNGKEITTMGTLVQSRITKRAGGDMSKIPGRRTAKTEGTAVYFDLNHGFYRPVIKNNIVKIW